MNLYDRIEELFDKQGVPISMDYLKANITTANIAEHMDEIADTWCDRYSDSPTERNAVRLFLEFAKTTPKPKRKFPFEKYERVMARDGNTTFADSWRSCCLEGVHPDDARRSDDARRCSFESGEDWSDTIAPFDKAYIGQTKPHPDQITAEDLKNYDLSEGEKGE